VALTCTLGGVIGAGSADLVRDGLAALGPLTIVIIGAVALVLGVGLRSAPAEWRQRAASRAALLVRRPGKGGWRVSTVVWLGAIVALAALFRAVLGQALHEPVVLGDELIYEGLAKGWALHGEPVLRGSLSVSNSVFYPLFLAPAFRLAANGADALVAAKVINAVAMAATAVPAYVFARRVVSRGWALGVAALAVFVPWTMYAALIMTESLFYPVFVAYAAVFVWTLERPTARRQIALLGTLALLVGVRAQGLTVALGTVVAILLAGAVDEKGLTSTVRRFLPTFVVFVAVAALGIAASLAGVAVPTSSYNVVFHSLDQVFGILKWGAWNLALFELPLGVIGLAAFPVALWGMLRRDAAPVLRSTAAVSTGLSVSLLASVALLSASPYGLSRLHERNLFYVTPLVLTCVAHWLQRGMRRPAALTAASAAACVALAWMLPQKLVEESNNVDVPSSFFLLNLDSRLPGVPFRAWVMIFAVLGAALLLVARTPVFPVFAIVLAFVAVTASVDYRDALSAKGTQTLAWVDRSLPPGAEANLIYLSAYGGQNCNASEQSNLTLWTEWFNTHLGPVEYVTGADPADGLPPPTQLTIGRGGTMSADGRPYRPRYVVLDSRQPIVGRRLKRFDLAAVTGRHEGAGASLTLWRVAPPLRFMASTTSLIGDRGRSGNLIPNGDFETGVRGWSGNTQTETIATQCSTFGSHAVNAMSVTTYGLPTSGVYRTRATRVQGNGTYIFAFYAKGESGLTVRPALEWSTSVAAKPSTIVQGRWVRLTRARHSVVLEATAPRGATAVTPAIVLGGAPRTTLLVDSVSLRLRSAASSAAQPRG
jgi:hypothetical protein